MDGLPVTARLAFWVAIEVALVALAIIAAHLIRGLPWRQAVGSRGVTVVLILAGPSVLLFTFAGPRLRDNVRARRDQT